MTSAKLKNKLRGTYSTKYGMNFEIIRVKDLSPDLSPSYKALCLDLSPFERA